MSKTSSGKQSNIQAKVKPYKEAVSALLELEKKNLAEIKKEPGTASLKHFALADEMLNLASNYLVINGITEAVSKLKNMDAINDARKSLIKSIAYLENVTVTFADAAYSEYEKKLAEIASVNAEQRYSLVRKMGFTLELLKNAYGQTSKWRWFFVELEGRYATVVKNIIDLRNATAVQDPGSPDYEPTLYHLRLAKKSLMIAADSFRDKFEFSTNDVSDLGTGMNFLSALRRLNIMLGDKEGTEVVKKKHDVWASKYEHKLKDESKTKDEPKVKKR